MTAWNAPPPPVLPAPGWRGRLRLARRLALALLWTTGAFSLYLGLAPLDRLCARLGGARAPWGPRIIRFWAAGALRLLGLRIGVRGRPMTHPGAFVANHAGWLDIIALQRATPVVFVAKSEVRAWPGIGLIGRAIGTVFVSRRPLDSRRQQDDLHRRLARGDRLGIFPEGTSTDGRRVLPFKSSIFGVFFLPDLRARMWIQPVTIAYRPRPDLPATLYAWWGEMEFAGHLLALLTHSTKGRVRVRFHPALAVADFADRKALAAAAWRAVGEGLAEPSAPPLAEAARG